MAFGTLIKVREMSEGKAWAMAMVIPWSVCGHGHFCIHVHCYVAFFPDITPCWTKGPFKCLIKFKPGIIYSLVRKTLQPILMHSSSVSMSSLSSMSDVMSRAVLLVFLCWRMSYPAALLITSLCSLWGLVDTQFSKYSLIIFSLLLLSSTSDYAYPKSWQRQVLLSIRIMWCYCKKVPNQIHIFW